MVATEATLGAPPTEEERRLALLLVQLADAVKQTIRQMADDAGLSIAQIDVLRQLRGHGPTPMSRLAEVLHCEASNLTGLVDRLEIRGLVERLPDPADRRVRVLALTADGWRTSEEAWLAVVQGTRRLRLEPEGLSQLESLLSVAFAQTAEKEF